MIEEINAKIDEAKAHYLSGAYSTALFKFIQIAEQIEEHKITDLKVINEVKTYFDLCNEKLPKKSNLPAVNPANIKKEELTPKKKKWFENMGLGNGKLDIGKNLMQGIAKKLIPKLKPMIEKSKPKMISYLRGEIDLKGEAMPLPHVERVIIVRLAKSPDGDPSKDDPTAYINRAHYINIQSAQTVAGEDLALEEKSSLIGLIDMALNVDLEAAMKEII